uniref:Tudor-knot domain-containing protein n=1 Tax=Panagrolaimus sp. JU765 TaxID=591449 RepID=A0AC34PWK6_9BILA
MSVKTRSEERESSSGTSSETKKRKNSHVFTATELEEKLSKLGRVCYSLNDRVLCKYPDGLFYEGKVIAVETDENGENLYTIHYQGWNSRHDEQIKQIDANKRFILYDDECALLAKKAANDARKLAAAKAELKKKELIGKTTQKREKKSGSVTSTKSSSNPSRDDQQDDQVVVDFVGPDDSEAEVFTELENTIET